MVLVAALMTYWHCKAESDYDICNPANETGFIGWLSNTGSSIKNWWDDTTPEITEWTSQAGNDVKGWFIDRGTDIENWWEDKGPAIKEWANQAGTDAKVWLKEKGPIIKEFAINLGIELAVDYIYENAPAEVTELFSVLTPLELETFLTVVLN